MKKVLCVVVLMVAMLGSAKPSALADAEGGSRFVREKVLAYGSDMYDIVFRAGQPARVDVIGDGDTDLDLYIYDQFGNIVASDTDYSDRCVAIWTPIWTGVFRLKIVNRGDVFNRYTLRTN